MSDLLERLAGQGKVFSASRFVADVRYNIRLYQHYEELTLLSGECKSPSFQSTELQFDQRIEAHFNELLTLHMEDGRKQDFWATGGRYEAYGGFH